MVKLRFIKFILELYDVRAKIKGFTKLTFLNQFCRQNVYNLNFN